MKGTWGTHPVAILDRLGHAGLAEIVLMAIDVYLVTIATPLKVTKRLKRRRNGEIILGMQPLGTKQMMPKRGVRPQRKQLPSTRPNRNGMIQEVDRGMIQEEDRGMSQEEDHGTKLQM